MTLIGKICSMIAICGYFVFRQIHQVLLLESRQNMNSEKLRKIQGHLVKSSKYKDSTGSYDQDLYTGYNFSYFSSCCFAPALESFLTR